MFHVVCLKLMNPNFSRFRDRDRIVVPIPTRKPYRLRAGTPNSHTATRHGRNPGRDRDRHFSTPFKNSPEHSAKTFEFSLLPPSIAFIAKSLQVFDCLKTGEYEHSFSQASSKSNSAKSCRSTVVFVYVHHPFSHEKNSNILFRVTINLYAARLYTNSAKPPHRLTT